MAPHSYSALYYPFIHFRNDEWLKLSALYWDRIGRIVPRSYETDDSETVRELGTFVETLRPDWVRPEFGVRFVDFVHRNARQLRAHYDVRKVDQWPLVPASHRPPRAGGPSGTDPRLGYVYFEKLSPDLKQVLLASRIAVVDPGDSRWIGMHPRLAGVYMTALADQLGGEKLMYPVTDEESEHLAVGGASIDRVAQALLLPDRPPRSAASGIEVEAVAACVAVRTVIPKGLASVPVSRILEFREKYPEERGRFQQHMHSFLAVRQWLAEARDRQVLHQRLADEYQKELLPQVNDLKQKLRDCRIDSVMGVLSMKVEMPGLALVTAGLLGVVAAPAGIAAGAALAVIPVLRARRAITAELRTSPVSYLLRAEEELRPAAVATSLEHAASVRWGSVPLAPL